LLAKGAAMNHKKNGSLKHLSIQRCIGSYHLLNLFFQSFRVSDEMHENWYGDKKIAKEMKKEQLEVKTQFGLQYLNLGFSFI
jgi:hypothetical protein